MPDRDRWTTLWPNPRDVVQSLGVIPKLSVLDLCCGDGYFTAPLANIVGGNVYALDLDPVMIELAKAEVARLHTSVLNGSVPMREMPHSISPNPLIMFLWRTRFTACRTNRG